MGRNIRCSKQSRHKNTHIDSPLAFTAHSTVLMKQLGMEKYSMHFYKNNLNRELPQQGKLYLKYIGDYPV